MGSLTTLVSPKESDAIHEMVASNSVGGTAAAYLRNQRTKLVWQSTTTTPFITVDAGAVVNWRALFLGYFNGEDSDEFRLRSASSEVDLTANPSFDSGMIPFYPAGSELSMVKYRRPHRLYTFGTSGARWWRVDFQWNSNSDGFVRGSRLILGTPITPVHSAEPGWEMIHGENVVGTEDMDGGESTRPCGARRRVSFGWQPGALTKADGANIKDMLLERGSSHDIVVCVDTSELIYPMDVLYVGRVKEDVSVKHIPTEYRQTGFTVTELGITEMR